MVNVSDKQRDGGAEGGQAGQLGHGESKTFAIKIDRTEFHVHENQLSGLQLRNLPASPIGPDRDLFEVVPGGSDIKIGNDDVVKMRDGLRFFTAPAQINPGISGVGAAHASRE